MTTSKNLTAELLAALKIAVEHIGQYREYERAMTTLGRGLQLSSAFQPDTADQIFRDVIRRAELAAATLKTRKTPPAVDVDPRTVDTSTMTRDQMFKFYHDTAPAEDLRFFLERSYMTPAVRLWAEGLALAWSTRQITNRAEFYRQYNAIMQQWRGDRYWERVIVPRLRIARRLAKADARRERFERHTVAA